jgi:hypothetical protein
MTRPAIVHMLLWVPLMVFRAIGLLAVLSQICFLESLGVCKPLNF